MDVTGIEFGGPLWGLWTIPLSALLMVASIVLYARIAGLRSFSKMTSFDFAITVAMGSVIGAVVVSTGTAYSVANGALALASLFAVQAAFAFARSHASLARGLLDNDPLLLMEDGGRLLEDNLRSARIAPSDVYAKLREANVLQLEEVRAVVLEATGDISVLHGEPGQGLHDTVMDGVRRRA